MNVFRALASRALCVAALSLPTIASALPFSQLIVFGDSLADGGNNAALVDAGFAVGIGIPPGARQTIPIPTSGAISILPYAGSNVYSNGPVWVEQFAAQLGQPLTPSLFGGTNYAFGGAKTGPVDPGPGSTQFPRNLLSQVADFLALPGAAPADALYIINGGANDVRELLGATSPDLLTIITDYVTNTVTMLNQLWSDGARNFLLATVADVGKTPFALEIDSVVPDTAAGATGLAFAMNQALQDALGSSLLLGGILENIDILDLFGLQQALVANPGAFGFDDVTTGCASDPACILDPSGTFFWDGIHPSTAGHAAIALEARRATVPEPGILVLVACGIGSMVTIRRTSGRLKNPAT